MKNYIVTIKHVTGSYNLRVSETSKNDLVESIMSCINNEKTSFSSTDEEGNLSIYPAGFLKESYISVSEDHGTHSSTVYEAEWNN